MARRARCAASSIPGAARRADRREQRRRVGRDGQQRRSERLGRRRGRPRGSESLPDARRLRGVHDAQRRDRRRGRRARARRDARDALGARRRRRTGAAGRSRCTRRGSSRRGSTSTSWGSRRPPTSRARACILARWAGPSLNWVLADRAGEIAWVVNGPLPRRVGFDGSRPESLADGSRVVARPSARRPARSAVATACCSRPTTARCRASAADAVSRMWMRPLRAKRIDELLAARRTFDERDFLAMQLDTRAEGYEQIRATILLEVVRERRARAQARTRARALASAWNGNADVDQAGVSDAARVLPRIARAHTRAAARAGDRRRSRASSIAGRSPTRRCGGCSTSGLRIC